MTAAVGRCWAGWSPGASLRPLQQITATARRVSQDTLDERIALEGPRDELKELADTFDAMLERLSGASPASGASWPTPRTSCARR